MSLRSVLRSINSHPRTREASLKTWLRWAFWQSRQCLTSTPMEMRYLNNTRLIVYPHGGLTGCWYYLHSEWEEMKFLQRFLQRGDRFFDVGANAGAYSILALGLGCEVVAMEPVPQTYARLLENAELNRDIGLCRCLPCGAGSVPSRLRMTSSHDTGNRIVSDETEMIDSEIIEVEIRPLDTIANEFFHPTFMKIDVEGHELEVLKGASAILSKPTLLGLLVETFRPHDWQSKRLRDIEDLLASHGFLPFQYNVDRRQIEPLVNLQDGLNNTFYFREPDIIQNRLNDSAT